MHHQPLAAAPGDVRFRGYTSPMHPATLTILVPYDTGMLFTTAGRSSAATAFTPVSATVEVAR
ncbi:hypothetical protein [Streptomyces sp. XH2]|uniref:hypothetical protein n=1 Tax=Streptomyces sp. XH2 TaxID=3412483 RepID=UPI003C7EB26E